jgi:glycogen operon protein
MVRALHAAGLEVILDVVYNHTGEGNHLGPMISFKGIDNRTYYRLDASPRYYADYTGTGNSLNSRNPQVLMLIMDSLRYWTEEMHVDGFRFDLATVLARQEDSMDGLSAFFAAIHQDPVLRDVKLIAEPWDVGNGGYQVGNFPVRWCEWNDKYRDTVRRYWQSGQERSDFSRRLAGSSDLFDDGRAPTASINFITAHDGFTLRDLVSYNEKHNEANGHDNTDGTSNNHSYNFGVEGPTGDPAINEVRRRQQRNLLATLLLSQGTPMLLGGDEIGRTQQGNNNAYVQDNAISWFDWEDADRALLDFTRLLIACRREHPVFRQTRWFGSGRAERAGQRAIVWLREDGHEMSEGDWLEGGQTLGVYLNGDALDQEDNSGHAVRDDSFLLLFNPTDDTRRFTLPALGRKWQGFLSTATEDGHLDIEVVSAESVEVLARSLAVLTA